MTTQHIAFTPGEPAGIGLDISIINAQQLNTQNLLTFTDPDLLLSRAKLLNLPIRLLENSPCVKPGDIAIYPVKYSTKIHTKIKAGQLNPNSAQFVLDTLDCAIKQTQLGKTSALLTGPVHKGIINEAGINFTGHTEYLANKTCSKTVMMLVNEKLRIALVTTHLPLKEVHTQITINNLTQTIKILHHSLVNQFGIQNPKIAICGLNPHAGEDGHLGKEEIEIINPAIKKLRSEKSKNQKLKSNDLNLTNALSADTLFTPKNLSKYDAILSMFHDQGLPVLKALGFENSVNITLGLPFIRTSVDHGTALSLAGTGNISLGSFNTALNYTEQLLSNEKSFA